MFLDGMSYIFWELEEGGCLPHPIGYATDCTVDPPGI